MERLRRLLPPERVAPFAAIYIAVGAVVPYAWKWLYGLQSSPETILRETIARAQSHGYALSASEERALMLTSCAPVLYSDMFACTAFVC